MRVEVQLTESGDGGSVVIGEAAEGRRDVFQSEERLVAGVCARFAWEQVRYGFALGRTEWATDGAVDGCADEVVGLIGNRFRGLRRISAKNLLYIEWCSLQHDVGGGKSADVAPGAGERHPWSRYVLARGRGKRKGVVRARRSDIRHQVSPVEEGRWKQGGAVRSENTEAIRHENSMVVGIKAGLGGEDVVGGMRDENGVIPGIERPILLNKVEQVRHLLQVGGHVGVVTDEVHIVEFYVHDVLDFPRRGVKFALSVC